MRKQMWIVLAADIETYDEPMTPDDEKALAERVLQAIIPHPDSRIATESAGEFVTVLATEWEVTN